MHNYYNPYADPEYFMQKQYQQSEIKRLGIYTGLAILCQIVLQNGISLLLEFAGVMEKYRNDGAFQNSVDIILVIVGLLVPFYFIGKKMQTVSRVPEPISLGKPFDMVSFILAIVSGIGFCMIANIITSYLVLFIEIFGVKLYSPEIAMPGGAVGVTTSILRVVVVAAIVEELALRGYVMGNLRKYGDKFAIIVSATLFAVIHGNLVQAPFALFAGFALGYLSVKTGTIWTGIAIHALNNFMSTAVSYAMDWLGEETASIIYMFVLYGFIIVGLIAFRFFNNRTKHISLREDYLRVPTKEKMAAFFLNPAMIVVLIYMLYITVLYIGFGA